MMFDDLTADRQPEARSARFVGERVACLAELLEDPRLVLRRDSDPGVRHADDDRLAGLIVPGPARNRPFGGEFHGVRDQVDDHLDQPIAVAHDSRWGLPLPKSPYKSP
jgi:hypothetical protein